MECFDTGKMVEVLRVLGTISGTGKVFETYEGMTLQILEGWDAVL